MVEQRCVEWWDKSDQGRGGERHMIALHIDQEHTTIEEEDTIYLCTHRDKHITRL